MLIQRRPIREISPSLSSLPDVIQRVYAARGVDDLSSVDKTLRALLPFENMKGIFDAAKRLSHAIHQDESILIIGDFDADGATSTALAVSALRALGAKKVNFLVPNRFKFGYGLTPAIVELAVSFSPALIVTVDNGISSMDGVATAKSHGIDVLITDHHLPGESLPAAVAIVNPNQPGCAFPSKSIAGVGVIFYVMLALRRQLKADGWFTVHRPEPNMAQFLDLVALGTVADVVGLDQNNRVLVSQGLARVRQGMTRPGIEALISVSGRVQGHLREMDLGFAIAPRLNAAGRLDDMSIGIACLLSETPAEAQSLAQRLDALNDERRKIEAEMKEQAFHALEAMALDDFSELTLPLGLCLTHESWHQGVIGVLAGRLKERYHRPVIIFSPISPSEMKGSARSIVGLNIRDVLAAIDVHHPGLLLKFGGHAMAAGLSIHPDSFSLFKNAFLVEIAKHIDLSACQGERWSDGPLSEDELSLDVALQLREAGPWGAQFPEPAFHNCFELVDQRIVGQQHLKLVLRHEEGQECFDAILFNADLSLWPNHRTRYVEALYTLDVNTFRNRTSLQLNILALEATSVRLPETMHV